MKKFLNIFFADGSRGLSFIRFFTSTAAITIFVFLMVSPLSCKLTEEGIELLPQDKSPPVITEVKTLSADSLRICFSESILLADLRIDLCGDDCTTPNYAAVDGVSYDPEFKAVTVHFSESTQVGEKYALHGIASDLTYNSLEFSQRFYGFNENPARLVLSEARVQKSGSNVEFIEFFVLKGGNTFGLEVVSAANEKRSFAFPAMEVSAGEYITFHGRTLDTETDVADELGSELSLSGGTDSSDGARDLWRSGNEKIVSQTDVILLKNNAENRVVDALLLCVSAKESWTKKMETYAKQAFDSGAWTSGYSVRDALVSDKMTTVHRTASRQNIQALFEMYKDSPGSIPAVIGASASDYLVTEKKGSGKNAVSGSTPGMENSSYTGE